MYTLKKTFKMYPGIHIRHKSYMSHYLLNKTLLYELIIMSFHGSINGNYGTHNNNNL